MTKINKIIDDTLKSPHGKWSRKSLTMFVSFIVSILLGAFIVVSNYFTEVPVNNDAILVFAGFLSMAGYQGKLTLDDKKHLRENSEESDEVQG